MKKQLSACVLTLALLLTCLPLSAAAAGEGLSGFQRTCPYSGFTDVPAGAWYENTVKTAVEFGVIDGVGNGRYAPSGSVTVAQAIKIAACIYSIYTTGSADFGAGSPWYQPYVDYAKQSGIVTGTWPDYNKAATRLEMAEIFVAALPPEALSEKNTVADNAIPDVPAGSTGAEQVYRLYRAGILQGSDDIHSYFPDTNVKRSELSAIVARLIVPDERLSLTMSEAFALKAPADLSGKSNGDFSVTLSWSKVPGANGYSICMATSPNGTYQYLPSVSDPGQTSYVVDVSKEGSYYFKVAGYRKVNGQTVTGPFSAPCGVTVTIPWEDPYAGARKNLKNYMGSVAAQWNYGSFQYSYYDMDGNGVPEMFIRNSNYPDAISAIYTYLNGHSVGLYADDYSDIPQGNNKYYWNCQLLSTGVVYYELDKEYYNSYGNPTGQVIGGDFCRLSAGKDALTPVQSIVYDYNGYSGKCYTSYSVSSRNYFAGSRSGFTAISESYFDSMYYDYAGYGYAVDIGDWNWIDF